MVSFRYIQRRVSEYFNYLLDMQMTHSELCFSFLIVDQRCRPVPEYGLQQPKRSEGMQIDIQTDVSVFKGEGTSTIRLLTSAMRKIRFNGGPLRKGYTVGVEGTLDTRSSPTVFVVLLFLRNCMEGAAVLCFMQFSQRWTLSRCRHHRPLSFAPEPYPPLLRSAPIKRTRE